MTFSAGVDQDWVIKARNFIAGSSGRLRLLENKVARGISYLGTNALLWFPDTMWVRLVMSPAFDPGHQFETYSTEYLSDSVISRYQKKDDYLVTSVLRFDSRDFVYNPATVDSALQCSRLAFAMEASHELNFIMVEDNRLFHAPWFIDYGGQWRNLEGRDWLVLGEYVVDVRGSGTYLSRRSRLFPPHGFTWLPFSDYGSHWVTCFRNTPSRHWGVSIVRNVRNRFVCFDHVVPVGYGDQFVRRVLTDDHVRYIQCGEEVEFDLTFRQLRQGERVLDWAWQFPNGLFSSPGSLVRKALLYVPRGGALVFDSQIHVRSWQTPFGTYVDVSEAPEGVVFVLSHVSRLSRICALASVYHSPPPSQYMSYVTSKENSLENEISYDRLSFRLRSHMNAVKIQAVSDPGLSVAKLGNDLNVPMKAVLYHLNRTPDYYCWFANGPVKSEFVSVDSLTLRFVGDKVGGSVDGMTWAEVLKEIHVGDNVLRFRSRQHVKFSNFLGLNGISTFVRREAAFDELVCYVPARRY